MSTAPDLSGYARRKTIQLTTTGRRSGKPRTVTIWFVVDETRRIAIQHVAKKPAHWYGNLSSNPRVTVDFGDGPLPGTAELVVDRRQIEEIVAKVGRKYWTYRLIRLFGGGSDQAVAALVTLDA